MRTAERESGAEITCLHCGQAIYQKQRGDDLVWSTVWVESVDPDQCPWQDDGIVVNDGHEPRTNALNG